MSLTSVLYHYTSNDGLAMILESGRILPSFPHSASFNLLAGINLAIPGWIAGVNLTCGAVFLTRMDPNNSREAIAFNNFRCIIYF